MISKERMLQFFPKVSVEGRGSRDQVIVEHLDWVYYVVKKYQYSNVDWLELFDVGVIGLIKAIDTFDGAKNIKLVTYASKCIENEILAFFKKNRRWNCYVQFSEPIYCDKNGQEYFVEDTYLWEEDPVFVRLDLECTCEEIRYILSKLSERDRKIVLLYFGFLHERCYTQAEISQMMGVSQSFVSRVLRLSLVTLREELLQLENVRMGIKNLKRKK